MLSASVPAKSALSVADMHKSCRPTANVKRSANVPTLIPLFGKRVSYFLSSPEVSSYSGTYYTTAGICTTEQFVKYLYRLAAAFSTDRESFQCVTTALGRAVLARILDGGIGIGIDIGIDR
jgi:hypothetical protein